MPESPSTVFISYAREDLGTVRKLYNDLKRAGANPWLDVESLIPGQKWRVEIKRAIRESRYFLVVLSSNSVSKRGYVQKEVAEALEILDEFPESEIFIIPVRLDDCSPSHEKLRDLHWVDMFPSWDNGVERILRATGAHSGGDGIPWKWAGIIFAAVVVLIALGAWLAPNAADFLSAWLSETPRVTPTSSPIHTPIIPTATLANTPVPPTVTPTFTPPPRPTPVPPTDTPPPSVTPDMVHVPAGYFAMGSNDKDVQKAVELCKERGDCEQSFGAEQPQHSVYLDAFYIDKTEVTNAQYRKCVEAGVCKEPSDTTYYNDENYAQHPVVYVDWSQAKAYCEWAGKRLPTEAEWEKAARGTDGRTFPWGEILPEGNLANFCDVNCTSDWRYKNADDGYDRTAPVGSYRDGASLYGALDMAGNVWEWVADWYGEKYYSVTLSRSLAQSAGRWSRRLSDEASH